MSSNSVQSGKSIPRWLCFVVVVLVVALDQVTKSLVSQHLQMGVPVMVLPGFDMLLAHNEGAAFSFLDDAGGWQRWLFTVISAVVSVALTVWLWRLPSGQRMLAIALVFTLAGAIGNLIDRIQLGYVVDFISLYYAQWRFATFNVADAAISCGAVLLVLDVILHGGAHD